MKTKLLKKKDYDAKINEIKGEILSITGLVKKTVYNTKISDIEFQYFITSDYNKFMSNILDTKIKEKKLVNESNTSIFINNPDLDKKNNNTSNKSRAKSRAG